MKSKTFKLPLAQATEKTKLQFLAVGEELCFCQGSCAWHQLRHVPEPNAVCRQMGEEAPELPFEGALVVLTATSSAPPPEPESGRPLSLGPTTCHLRPAQPEAAQGQSRAQVRGEWDTLGGRSHLSPGVEICVVLLQQPNPPLWLTLAGDTHVSPGSDPRYGERSVSALKHSLINLSSLDPD
ncbi:hypothetical protein P7K49_009471 [Saguinus oedipus]|uniref:Uncharacterized protein n=1 Tax=Saguinus oedipus TaxID=9490 RepID=A0ABQ9VKU7_SAGOE|nr:hypothetical protein P7K49_009471 [Saguinus oedipus]